MTLTKYVLNNYTSCSNMLEMRKYWWLQLNLWIKVTKVQMFDELKFSKAWLKNAFSLTDLYLIIKCF